MQTAPWITNYLTEHFADDAYRTLAGYTARGGYEAARKALREMRPPDVIELVKNAGLQGFEPEFTVRVYRNLLVDQEMIEFICNENEQSTDHIPKPGQPGLPGVPPPAK